MSLSILARLASGSPQPSETAKTQTIFSDYQLQFERTWLHFESGAMVEIPRNALLPDGVRRLPPSTSTANFSETSFSVNSLCHIQNCAACLIHKKKQKVTTLLLCFNLATGSESHKEFSTR